MLAGIKFIDKSEVEKAVEEDRKALKKQKKKDKKVSTCACCCACGSSVNPLMAVSCHPIKASSYAISGNHTLLQVCSVMPASTVHAACTPRVSQG